MDSEIPEGLGADEQAVGQRAPWHFWLVVFLLILYVGWRIIVFVADIF